MLRTAHRGNLADGLTRGWAGGMEPAARACLESDPALARVIGLVGPLTLKPRRRPPCESLVHSIIHQQLSGRAAATILGRFREQVGGGRFPGPEVILATPVERLRAAGLSGAKAAYIQAVAGAAVQGTLPTLRACARLNNEEIIAVLTAVKGIGRWTAEMFLIFNLGRPDVLPVLDLGVRRGFQVAHGRRQLPAPRALARHGQRWAPHRTLATLYLWQAANDPARFAT